MSDDDRPDTPPAPKPRLKRLRFLAILFAVLVLGLISFVFGMFVAVASDLPSLTRFSQIENAKSSVLLDDLGTLDMDFSTSSEIAPRVRTAVDSYINGR